MIKLTSHQQEGKDFILECIKNKQNCRLLGSAGVGKSVLISEIAREFNYNKFKLLAPTHKARKVLKSKANKECMTTHSFLGLKMRRIKGKKIFAPPISGLDTEFGKILGQDEASMIGNRDEVHEDQRYGLLNLLEQSSSRFDNTVIYILDGKQLPPVKESHSPVLKLDIPEFELTEIIRQGKGNDNIELSRNLHWLNDKTNGTHYKWSIPEDNLYYMLAEVNGTDEIKYITWTNDKVKEVNNIVRDIIYNNPNEIEEGEYIVLKESCEGYHNRDEIKVNNLSDGSMFGLNYWRVNKDLLLLKQDSLSNYKKLVKSYLDAALKNRKLWRQYYALLDTFTTYQHNHAVTVHSSQGSTYEDSIVDVSLIKCSPDDIRDKMLYTAITRTSNQNYLL